MTPNKSVGYHENGEKCCDQNCLPRDHKSPDFHNPRPRKKCLRVSDLVYKFLEDVASLNDERRQRNNARTNFQRAHVRKHNSQSRRPNDPKSTDEILLLSQYQIPKNRIWEDCDAMAPLEKKSSSQFVKDYVKAVKESKRRAERYICKALSFGVEAGFLVPNVDSEGHIIRVSSALEVDIFERNRDLRKETETDDPGNRVIGSFQRGKEQNQKSDESTSRTSKNKRWRLWSEKSKRKPKRSSLKEKKGNPSPGPAKKRGKSIDGKRGHKSRNKSEDNDSVDSDTEKSSSGFTNETDNVSKPIKSDSSLEASSKKRRFTEPDKSSGGFEVAKNNVDENHDGDTSEASDYGDTKNRETKNN